LKKADHDYVHEHVLVNLDVDVVVHVLVVGCRGGSGNRATTISGLCFCVDLRRNGGRDRVTDVDLINLFMYLRALALHAFEVRVQPRRHDFVDLAEAQL
jgi:hypothetical protein